MPHDSPSVTALRYRRRVRLATWNCYSELAWDEVERLDADVVTIQECRPDTPDLVSRREEWMCEYRPGRWGRGIAVLTRSPYRIEMREPSEVFAVSTLVSGPRAFRFVGFWAMTPNDVGYTYTRQARRVIEQLPRDDRATVMAGDFNAETNEAHLANIQGLAERGLASTYYRFHGVDHGAESNPTRYHEWKESLPLHIDFLFAQESWAIEKVEVGAYRDYCPSRLSDHVPVVVSFVD